MSGEERRGEERRDEERCAERRGKMRKDVRQSEGNRIEVMRRQDKKFNQMKRISIGRQRIEMKLNV